MKVLFALFLTAHGLIHLLGAAKVFQLASLPQLTQPITKGSGVLWLASALLFVAAAVSILVWPRWWWVIGAAAIAISCVAIVPSWADAKFGALANAVALVGVIVGLLWHGPWSLRAEYDRDVTAGLARPAAPSTLTEADIASLPPPVQRYLRVTGAIGQPRVVNIHVRMRGRIRNGPDARWMPFSADQYSFYPAMGRLFYMNASMLGLPIQGYHRYIGTAATMLVKAAAAVPVARISGPEATQAETVTLFNDMCIMAPATLIHPAIAWESVDAHTVRATFTNAGATIRAELSFNETGEMVNFWSDDRRQLSQDGRTLRPVRWSTPIHSYRSFGAIRLASRGEGRWHEPDGEYAYIDIEIDDVRYNVSR